MLLWLSGYVVVVVAAAESAADQSPVHDWRLHDPVGQRSTAVWITATTRQPAAGRLNAAVVDRAWRRECITLQGRRRALSALEPISCHCTGVTDLLN